MKFNLKNRPPRSQPLKLHLWFEGFEKEVRLILAFYLEEPWGTCEYQEDIVKKLKEILGE